MTMNAVLVPGQGSQTPGMLTAWFEQPGAAATLAEWSSAADLDLLRLGTTADADEIRDTAVAQPLLTATALLSTRGLAELPIGVTCGHSVGEITALVVAGVLEPIEAIWLAAGRGRAMAAAAAEAPTGLVALLGGVETDVLTAVKDLGLEVATVNVPGQVVVGGPQALLDQLQASPPAGTRVRPLAAAGAFHTSAMRSAVPAMQAIVAQLNPKDAHCPVVANADGRALTSGRELVDRLVAQLTGPVRFDSCLTTIAGFAPETVVELAPSGTLTAIAKRALVGAAFVAPELVPA
jgi:[acyl-carrier-protein] S-malonyltransferase